MKHRAFFSLAIAWTLSMASHAEPSRQEEGEQAASILATCLHFTWLARVGRIDMPLTLTITVALGAGKFAGAVGAYNALALLSKNPAEVEAALMKKLGLPAPEISTQVTQPCLSNEAVD